MSLRKSEILSLWQREHGPLSHVWRSRFLADRRTAYLTRFDPVVVRRAISMHRKLDDIVEEAMERHNRKLAELKRTKQSNNSRSRFAFGHYPHQPADTELHKWIGRTQRYSDDF